MKPLRVPTEAARYAMAAGVRAARAGVVTHTVIKANPGVQAAMGRFHPSVNPKG
jgi:hypothetical protein